jgi:hypothetical protein
MSTRGLMSHRDDGSDKARAVVGKGLLPQVRSPGAHSVTEVAELL